MKNNLTRYRRTPKQRRPKQRKPSAHAPAEQTRAKSLGCVTPDPLPTQAPISITPEAVLDDKDVQIAEFRARMGLPSCADCVGDETILALLDDSCWSVPLAISKYLGFPASAQPPSLLTTVHSALPSTSGLHIVPEVSMEWEVVSTDDILESTCCCDCNGDVPSVPAVIAIDDLPDGDPLEPCSQLYRRCGITIVENHMSAFATPTIVGKRVAAPSPDVGWIDVRFHPI